MKTVVFSPVFLGYEQTAAKYYKQAVLKVEIKSTDIMALNIEMVTRTLDFVCHVLQMLSNAHTGSLPETIIQSLLANTARLGNNC